VVLYGDTHEELVTYWDGVMILNPGSPTYPGRRHKRGVLGTIGILDIDGEDVSGRIIELDSSGLLTSP
jgi:predicted phosphodiesterase